jgi:predicted anti-sigma-YlaC factor YlaD
MNCPECEELLQRRLDGEPLADRVALDRHLTECTVCRERFAGAARIQEEWPLRTERPSVEWTEQTVSSLLLDCRGRRRRRLGLTALATAAGILAAVLAGRFWAHTSRLSHPVDLRAHHERHEQAVGLPAQEPSLQATVAEAERAVRSLTDRIADNTVGPVRTLIAVAAPAEVGPMPTLPTVAAIEQPLDPAARSLQETGRGVSTGIQTVASSARRAFDFLLREMPPVSRD